MAKIHIAIPNRDASKDINADLSRLMTAITAGGDDVLPDGYTADDVFFNFSYMQPVDANRNRMVDRFLDDEEAEWLYMNDSDVVPPEDILHMIDHDKYIVSGTVCIRKGMVPQPLILKDDNDGGYEVVDMEQYIDSFREDDGLVDVDAVGTGCLLIHRSVLENMEAPYFKFEYDDKGDLAFGEDLYFAREADDRGYDMFVDTSKLCKHFKTVDLSEVAQGVARGKKDVRDRFIQEINDIMMSSSNEDDLINRLESLKQRLMK